MASQQRWTKKSDRIAASIERKLDKAHGMVDKLLWPLAPIDGVIHGAARGVRNWLCDEHPSNTKTTTEKETTKKKVVVVRCSSDGESGHEEEEEDIDNFKPPHRNKGGPRVNNTGSNINNNMDSGNKNSVNGKVNVGNGARKPATKK